MAAVGERNPHGVASSEKTERRSGNHGLARVLVVQRNRGHEGGIKGCDLHVPRCRDCDSTAGSWLSD